MKVSIITPTADREKFLNSLYSLVQKQTYSDWEWLIYDSSLKSHVFSDARVIYLHDDSIISIGEKRNRLIDKASGEIIVHFDDDDYYAPNYIAFVVDQLKRYDFYTTHSWFSYDMKSQQTYYWATDEITRTQFFFNALSGSRVRELDFGADRSKQQEQLNQKGRYGYGFSYAYRKTIMAKCRFEDRDFGEDRNFYDDLITAGFSVGMEADKEGKAIHIIHETNTSGEYPQYRIPHFLAQIHLPHFFSYLAAHHDKN